MSHEPSGIYRPKLSHDGRFTIIPNDWIRNSELSPHANYLLIYLVSHQIGYQIRFEQISAETGLGVRALRSAISELQNTGWLIATREKKPNGQLGTYRFEVTEARVRLSTVAHATVDHATVAHRTDNKKTILKENNIKENNDKEFCEFWNEYPRKLDKGKAKRAFASAITRASFEDILAGAIRYKNDPNRLDEFTKYPASWLNADSWENAPLPDDPRAAKKREAKEQERLMKEWGNLEPK